MKDWDRAASDEKLYIYVCNVFFFTSCMQVRVSETLETIRTFDNPQNTEGWFFFWMQLRCKWSTIFLINSRRMKLFWKSITISY